MTWEEIIKELFEEKTTKRFKSINCGLQGQYIKDDGNVLTIDEVVELLNELHDKNKFLSDFRGFITMEHQKMKEENEELKQENQELRHFKLSIKSFAECNDNINRRTLNDLIGGIDYD